MNLSARDRSWLRGKVGSSPDDAELEARYELVGTRGAVARAVLSERLADLSAAPARFDVAGAYSQDTSANIAALEAALADPELYEDVGTPDRAALLYLVPPAPEPRR